MTLGDDKRLSETRAESPMSSAREHTAVSLPVWARAEKYEYDLGMATECERCGKRLEEGAVAYRDTESSARMKEIGYPGIRADYYCSTECVRAAEGSTP